MEFKNLENSIKKVQNIENFRVLVRKIQLISYNKKADKEILRIIESSIKKGLQLDDKISLTQLFSLKISQLHHLSENIPIVMRLNDKILSLSESINYNEGIALFYAHRWYIEKFNGNKEEADIAIKKSIQVLNKIENPDKLTSNICKYTYAVELWLEENNPQSASILEECVDFFHKEGFYRSLVQALTVLFVIYQDTQNRKGALKATQKLLSNKIPFDNLPNDIQAISYYFIGLSHKLQLNLSLAERYLEKARKILKETFEKSIYSFYYIPVLTHLSTVLALQGEIEQSLELIKTAETLLQGKIFSNYSDPISSRQLKHSFNLVNFYIKSRIYDSASDEIIGLIDNIYTDCKINYSNAIMLTEFLLNAHLNHEQLIELKNTNNA
ncbi:MAG: hypothetical protein H7647_10265, partial [Candidatus Heimdallarchaeota archaeon]|nr:hypothetical protein [Candidatus Heimdallarchaeota archaeon]MCK4254809.1 hypothetical protein [Candidatus Heimdallarchaeota archaeon]